MRRAQTWVAHDGSSPQARGTPPLCGAPGSGARFIPAGAGNTCRVSVVYIPDAVHPRRRGEHDLDPYGRDFFIGSSPQARGTPVSPSILLILLCHIMSCVRGAMWLSLTHCFIKVFYDDLAKFPLPPWKRPFSGSQITSTLILSHFRNFCHLAPAASVAHSTAISVDYSRHLVGACYA